MIWKKWSLQNMWVYDNLLMKSASLIPLYSQYLKEDWKRAFKTSLNIDINALANGKIEEPKTNDTTATASEKELLKNYRRLDKYGKTTVKSIINCEYKRVQEQSSQIQEKKHLSSHKNRILHNLYLNIALFVFITAF